MNYTRFFNDGLEFYIDVKTGETLTSQRSLARMVGKYISVVQNYLKSSDLNPVLENPETLARYGLRTDLKLYSEDTAYKVFLKYKPELLVQCAKAGLRVYLHGLAGFKWVSVPPQTPLEWSETREKGIEVRKDLTDQIKHYIETHPELSPNTKKWLYSNVSILVCKGVFGVKPSEVAKKWSANPKTVRDYFTREELKLSGLIEESTQYFIWSKGLNPLEAVKRAIEALDVKPLPTGDQPRIPMRTPKKRLKGI